MRACAFPGCPGAGAGRFLRRGLCPGHDKQRERGRALAPLKPRAALPVRPWTPREAEYLADEYSMGVMLEDIARALGRSYWSVWNRMRAQGLSRGKPRRAKRAKPMPWQLPPAPVTSIYEIATARTA